MTNATAAVLRRYPSDSMASRTLTRVASDTLDLSFSTRETVWDETSASSATSCIEGLRALLVVVTQVSVSEWHQYLGVVNAMRGSAQSIQCDRPTPPPGHRTPSSAPKAAGMAQTLNTHGNCTPLVAETSSAPDPSL